MKKLIVIVLGLLFMMSSLTANQITRSGKPGLSSQEIKSHPLKREVKANRAMLLEEGFEGTFPPADWTLLDADGDTHNWIQGVAPGQAAHTGTQCAVSESWDQTPYTPDNWLITPAITISAEAAGASLSWWVAAQDPDWPAEKYGLFVSTTGTAPENFTQLMVETLSSDTWIEKTQSLSAYNGQTIYLAWRHFDCTDMFQMKIDDIVVTSGTKQVYSENFENTTTTSSKNLLTRANSKNFPKASVKSSRALLTGYKIYRNGAVVHTINDGATVTYTDAALQNGEYSYYVTATYSTPTGESDPSNTASVTIGVVTDFSWIEQNTGFATASRGINDIVIVDENTVWASSYDGSGGSANTGDFTRTLNGGTNWTAGTVNAGSTYNWSDLTAISGTTAWAAMYNASGGGRIYKTTDGGANWTHQTTAAFTAPNGFPNVVHFWNENDGFCQGDPNSGYFEFYTTTDGGTNWERVPQTNIPANLSGEYGLTRLIEVKDNTIWFGTNKGRIFKNTNKGVGQWSVYTVGTTTEQITQHKFADQNKGICISSTGTGASLQYHYRKTTDGGENWTTLESSGPIYEDMSYIPGTNEGYVSVTANQDGPGSSYSANFGTSWNAIDSGTQYTTVSFLSPTVGWAGGFNQDATTGGIFKFNGNLSVGINETAKPTSLVLNQNYPNPFNPNTTISLNLPQNDLVKLTVFNSKGEVVKVLANKNLNAGSHQFVFNAAGLNSGVYFYRVETSLGSQTKKMMMIK